MEQTTPLEAFSTYVNSLRRERSATSGAKELTYRGALKTLLESLDDKILAVHEPARSAVGAPDFVIEQFDTYHMRKQPNQSRLFSSPPLALVECKDIGISLDDKENQKQLEKYFEMSGNILHTDYLEFRFYINKSLKTTIRLCEIQDGLVIIDSAQYQAFQLAFYDLLQPSVTIRTPKMLAELMADRARYMRDVIRDALTIDLRNKADTELSGQYHAFKDQLVSGLKPSAFADLYAQTLAYGLFAARYHDKTIDTFSLDEAAANLPKTNPFLQRFFYEIARYEQEDRINWVLDGLVDVFNRCNVYDLMKHAGGEWSKQHDPIIHFYETFLDKYDPELRRKMGVYYTPLPVVRYMVRAVDDTLKKEFGLQDGLADKSKIVRTTKVHPYGKREQRKGFGEGVEYVHRVQVLDPALGTGTFLNEIIKYIADAKKPQLGTGWSDYVEKDLLPRIHGFEIMMAPYAMSHLRLNLTLAETGYKSTSNQRLGVYLTNTLEKPHVEADELPNLFGFQKILANESQQADEVKTKTPVMVVIGNPPYSGISANMGDFARTLINRYREINGKKVIERGALQLEKNLNDDYVKFIAYAESIIEKNGQGIVAMITNNNYVDAITLRGLRWRLMQTFDSVKVLDLHGSTKKGEKTPDGYKDENVFNIEQGVSIVIAVKGNQINKGIASVAKADAYGTAKHKFELLDRNEFQFDTLKFQDNAYKFIYKDYAKEEEYLQGISVIELFPLYSSGVVTARDKFTIDISYENMWRRIERFSEISVEQARHDFNLGEDSTTWLVSKALKDVTASGPKKELVRKIDYRPFDQRYTYYTGNVVGFYTNPRKPVMQHFLDDKNIGMMVCRQQKTKGFSHVLAHSHIVESSYVSNKTSEIGYSIPLFRIENGEYISNIDEGARKNLLRNVSSNFCDIIDENSDKSQIVPKNIFDYVYGYLHDARYRETYPEFLKEDFPRVPKPKAADEFWRYVAYGSKLRKLHLMEPGSVPAQFFPPQGDGDMTIEKVSFVETHDGIGNVYFNGTDYFENIPRIAYDFTIGAYRPAYHWLNSRKGRMLTNEDVEYYQKIINVLLETFRVMKEIG